MIVFLGTNILISAALNSKGVPYQAFLKAVTYPNKAIICEQNLVEIKNVFQRKFPDKLKLLEQFLTLALQVIELVPIPYGVNNNEILIRDIADRPILRSAICAKADIVLTGDKDFLESDIRNPKMMTASQFLNL